MDKRIITKIIEDAKARYPHRGVSGVFDAYPDPGSALPAIMRDAGRSEVMDFFISRLTGEHDIRFDEEPAAEPEGPIPVDEYLQRGDHVR